MQNIRELPCMVLNSNFCKYPISGGLLQPPDALFLGNVFSSYLQWRLSSTSVSAFYFKKVKVTFASAQEQLWCEAFRDTSQSVGQICRKVEVTIKSCKVALIVATAENFQALKLFLTRCGVTWEHKNRQEPKCNMHLHQESLHFTCAVMHAHSGCN